MFSEQCSRKIYMNYLRLQQVICKFADLWLCWLWARMILVFSIVADLWCGWWWFSWSLLTLLTFGADDDGGRLLLLVFSARAANFTTRLFLIMPGGHKLLMVGTNGTNCTNCWWLATLSTTTAATINSSCIIYSPNNYLSTHSYDVMIWLATSIKNMAFHYTLEISQILTSSSNVSSSSSSSASRNEVREHCGLVGAGHCDRANTWCQAGTPPGMDQQTSCTCSAPTK